MSKVKGTYYEHRAMKLLETMGFVCCRAGASLGLFDIIAIGSKEVKAIQVKGGLRPYLRPLEREAIELLAVPACVSKELWQYYKHARLPVITSI